MKSQIGYTDTFLKAGVRAFVTHLGVALLNEQRIILWNNIKFRKLMRLGCKQSLIGKSITDIKYFETEHLSFERINKMAETGNIWHRLIQRSHSDITAIQLYGNIIPLGKNKNRRYLFFITERAVTETIQRKKMLEYVAFTNSHRIRQPISTMLGLLDLIQMNHINEHEKERCILYLKDCVNNLDKYSRDLSEFIYKKQQSDI